MININSAPKQQLNSLEQDLIGFTPLETFTLDVEPINIEEILCRPHDRLDATETRAGVYTGGDFNSRQYDFLERQKNPVVTSDPVSISSFMVEDKKDITGDEIRKKLGKAKQFLLDQIVTLISNQSELEGGDIKMDSPLDSSFNLNLFLVKYAIGDKIGVVSVQYDKDEREWRLYPGSMDHKYTTNGQLRVFSRND